MFQFITATSQTHQAFLQSVELIATAAHSEKHKLHIYHSLLPMMTKNQLQVTQATAYRQINVTHCDVLHAGCGGEW